MASSSSSARTESSSATLHLFPSNWVKFVAVTSEDDHLFILNEDVAKLSDTLKVMLECVGPLSGNIKEEGKVLDHVHLGKLHACGIKECIIYLVYKHTWNRPVDERVPHWEPQSQNDNELHHTVQSADFLDA